LLNGKGRRPPFLLKIEVDLKKSNATKNNKSKNNGCGTALGNLVNEYKIQNIFKFLRMSPNFPIMKFSIE
jgi:hypothetical protein